MERVWVNMKSKKIVKVKDKSWESCVHILLVKVLIRFLKLPLLRISCIKCGILHIVFLPIVRLVKCSCFAQCHIVLLETLSSCFEDIIFSSNSSLNRFHPTQRHGYLLSAIWLQVHRLYSLLTVGAKFFSVMSPCLEVFLYTVMVKSKTSYLEVSFLTRRHAMATEKIKTRMTRC